MISINNAHKIRLYHPNILKKIYNLQINLKTDHINSKKINQYHCPCQNHVNPWSLPAAPLNPDNYLRLWRLFTRIIIWLTLTVLSRSERRPSWQALSTLDLFCFVFAAFLPSFIMLGEGLFTARLLRIILLMRISLLIIWPFIWFRYCKPACSCRTFTTTPCFISWKISRSSQDLK